MQKKMRWRRRRFFASLLLFLRGFWEKWVVERGFLMVRTWWNCGETWWGNWLCVVA
jgi:hypothetical protein